MLAGSIFTISLKGSNKRRPMEIGAPQRGVVLGELLAADAAGRVDAGPGLVDDHVADLALKLAGDQLGHEVLRLAAGRAVADGDHRQLQPLDHLQDDLLGLLRSGLPIR